MRKNLKGFQKQEESVEKQVVIKKHHHDQELKLISIVEISKDNNGNFEKEIHLVNIYGDKILDTKEFSFKENNFEKSHKISLMKCYKKFFVIEFKQKLNNKERMLYQAYSYSGILIKMAPCKWSSISELNSNEALSGKSGSTFE